MTCLWREWIRFAGRTDGPAIARKINPPTCLEFRMKSVAHWKFSTFARLHQTSISSTSGRKTARLRLGLVMCSAKSSSVVSKATVSAVAECLSRFAQSMATPTMEPTSNHPEILRASVRASGKQQGGQQRALTTMAVVCNRLTFRKNLCDHIYRKEWRCRTNLFL
jgi:hypothetical protein